MHGRGPGDISKILHQLPDPRTVYSEDVARVDVLEHVEGRQSATLDECESERAGFVT
jgi:hypothetical protein